MAGTTFHPGKDKITVALSLGVVLGGIISTDGTVKKLRERGASTDHARSGLESEETTGQVSLVIERGICTLHLGVINVSLCFDSCLTAPNSTARETED